VAKEKIRDTERDAKFLGLRKAEETDDVVYQGYALVDVTQWGPSATDRFLLQVLKQKVNNLLSPNPKHQSEDPFEPQYAPLMWRP